MITDPFLRKLIEDALKGGNTSLGRDLEPGAPSILRRPTPPFVPDTIPDTNPLPGGTPPPRGPQPSLIDRMLSGIYVPPAPSMHGYEKNRASRMFLSGLTGAIAKNHGGPGYGSGVLGAIGGRNHGGGAAGPKVDPLADLRRALLQAQIEATGALKGTRDARTAEINQPDDKVDPFEAEKEAWWNSRTDANKALAESRRRPKAAAGRGAGGGGKGGGGKITEASERAQINAEFAAEKKRIENAFRQKYANIHDTTNSVGMPQGTGIRDAAIARGLAEVNMRHQLALRRHAEKWGLDTALPDAGQQRAPAGKAITADDVKARL